MKVIKQILSLLGLAFFLFYGASAMPSTMPMVGVRPVPPAVTVDTPPLFGHSSGKRTKKHNDESLSAKRKRRRVEACRRVAVRYATRRRAAAGAGVAADAPPSFGRSSGGKRTKKHNDESLSAKRKRRRAAADAGVTVDAAPYATRSREREYDERPSRKRAWRVPRRRVSGAASAGVGVGADAAAGAASAAEDVGADAAAEGTGGGVGGGGGGGDDDEDGDGDDDAGLPRSSSGKAAACSASAGVGVGACRRVAAPYATRSSAAAGAAYESLFAEIERLAANYGYKAANLMMLDEILKNEIFTQALLERFGITVEVPEFICISNEEAIGFLEAQGIDITTRAGHLPADVDAAAIARSERIALALAAGEAPVAKRPRRKVVRTRQFEDLASMLSSMIVDWLQGEADKKHRLMVRSTGKEDSAENSNAGGNASFANIDPAEPREVQDAVRNVIASYFEAKGITQEMLTACVVDLRQVFIPVLLQRRIGEDDGDGDDDDDAAAAARIPVSCVVFTTEAAGNTPGVTFITAGFGYGDGVVGDRCSADTFYVDSCGNVQRRITRKPKRLVPTSAGGLVEIDNPEEMQDASALDTDEVLAIKAVADLIQEAYGKPMDIEIVYNREERRIYVVQARPVCGARGAGVAPSYLNYVPDEGEIFYGRTIVPANSAVIEITESNQVIIANNLPDALDNQFLKLSKTEQDRVQAVLVKELAEPTSHAATILRQERKAVLTVEEFDEFKKRVAQNPAMFISPQQEKVVFGACTKEDGVLKHPISECVSVCGSYSGEGIPVVAGALPTLEEIFAQLEEIFENLTDVNLNRLLTLIAQQYHLVSSSTFDASDLSRKLAALYHHAAELVGVMRSENILLRPVSDVTRLYYINFLHALCFQRSRPGVVNCYSFAGLIKAYASVSEAARRLPGIRDADLLASSGAVWEIASKTEIADAWDSFVRYCAESDQTPQLKSLWTAVSTFDMSSPWFHFVFFTEYNQHSRDEGGMDAVAEKLFSDFSRYRDALRRILELKTCVETFITFVIEHGSGPETFSAFYAQLERLVEAFTHEDFLHLVDSEIVLVRLAAVALLEKFVDTFDKSIKALKGSTAYADRVGLQVERFKQLVQLYFSLLHDVAVSAHVPMRGKLHYHNLWSLETYLDRVNRILEALPTSAEQMHPSRDFSVTNAALGSSTAFERNFPESLEDVFTLCHQNFLVIVGLLVNTTITSKQIADLLPENAQLLFNTLRELENVSLIGINFSGDNINLRFNRPLANHSVVFEMTVNKEETLFAIKFVGEARERWKNINDICRLFVCCYKDDLSLKSTVIGLNELAIDLEIKRFVRFMGRFITMICDMANNGGVIPSAADLLRVLSGANLLSVARDAVLSEASVMYALGIDLFRALVAREQEFDEAISMASDAVVSGNRDVRMSGLNLFRELVARGQGLSEAIKAAREADVSGDYDVRMSGLNLFRELVAKGQGFAEAIEAARTAVVSRGYFLCLLGINLFRELVAKGQGFAEAIKAARGAAVSEFSGVRGFGEALFSELEATGAVGRE